MRKYQIIGTLNHFFCDSETYSLENRIFDLVMLLVLVAAIITTTYCIILHDHIILTASSVTVVFLSIIALLYSSKTGKYQMLVKPVILYFFVLMIGTWIANSTSSGRQQRGRNVKGRAPMGR